MEKDIATIIATDQTLAFSTPIAIYRDGRRIRPIDTNSSVRSHHVSVDWGDCWNARRLSK